MRQAVIALALIGCSSKTGAEGDTPEPDPKGWTITVDMSGFERFAPPDATSWPVNGTATATEGLASVDVNGAPATVDLTGAGGDAFASMITLAPGHTRVPVLARDQAGHERKGDRSVIAARFLNAGDHNMHAASLVLDDAILAAMGEGLASQAGTVDVAGEILARPILSQDDRCVTWPVEASQGEVAVRLVEDKGNLWLNIRIPNLYVYFEGECQGVFSTIPLGGEMTGTIDIWSQLTGKPPVDGQCLTAFTHSEPEVEVQNWGFGVWGLGGPLQNWIISAFSGSKSTEARNQIASEVATRADTLLTEKLANMSVFDRSSQLDLLGKPIAMHLCLGALDKVGQTLVARVAASASSDGNGRAPGAPMLDSTLPAVARNELLLDGNLVAQLLFASWKAGGLTRSAPDADISVLQILVPELSDYSANAQVTVDGELPPLVAATPDGPGDLAITIPDLMVDITTDGTNVFRFGVVLTLALDLTPMDGKLVPTVVNSTAIVSLLDERFDGPAPALEQAIGLQIGNVASQLIGADAAIALPDLPGLGAPTDVTADSGGRFLRVKL